MSPRASPGSPGRGHTEHHVWPWTPQEFTPPSLYPCHRGMGNWWASETPEAHRGAPPDTTASSTTAAPSPGVSEEAVGHASCRVTTTSYKSVATCPCCCSLDARPGNRHRPASLPQGPPTLRTQGREGGRKLAEPKVQPFCLPLPAPPPLPPRPLAPEETASRPTALSLRFLFPTLRPGSSGPRPSQGSPARLLRHSLASVAWPGKPEQPSSPVESLVGG